MNKLAAGCVFVSALLAAVAFLPRASSQESNPSKPAPEDIPPVRMIADPYPAFNGVAVDAAEFGNVGAGAEMRALALDKRHQEVLARLNRGADRRQSAPHRAGHRIAAFGAVENHAGERRLEAQGYVGHEGLGTPGGDALL